MVNNVSLVSVWVKDIEESKAFYIDVLGFEERDDVVLGDDFRWCTVGHRSQPELHVHLTTPGPPLSPEFAEAIIRAQAEGGTFALGISVDDCIATVVDLEAKGVEVISRPEERPYGVEALIRDNSGNWIVMVENRDWTAQQIAELVGDDPSSLNPMASTNGTSTDAET
jgi:catechol 2,3-dioxygenase-like lactoylglutathione lyase family enzyme